LSLHLPNVGNIFLACTEGEIIVVIYILIYIWVNIVEGQYQTKKGTYRRREKRDGQTVLCRGEYENAAETNRKA
jgi:hypothetical protein